MTWRNSYAMQLLGMGAALPGSPIGTTDLVELLWQRFNIDIARPARAMARRIGVRHRHFCRDLLTGHEVPRFADTNAKLSARAVESALKQAGLEANDLGYLIAHTATPSQLLPPNAAQVTQLLDYHGPYLELRQACTGFANALVIAQGLLQTTTKPIVIVGSETGSVYFDPQRVMEDNGQLVNCLQMGDGAAACILAPADNSQSSGARISSVYYGQLGGTRASAFSLNNGSDAPYSKDLHPEFRHSFAAVKEHGVQLFDRGLQAAREFGIDHAEMDYVIPHQANGNIAALLAPHLKIDAKRIFANADRVGNTGSAAIWLALHDLRMQMKPGQRTLILGAEATQYMYGGFLYEHL